MVNKPDYTKINQSKNYCNTEILDEVIEERGSTLQLVSEIIDRHSKFIKRTIETGAFETVTLPYLGKIKSNPRKVQATSNRVNRPNKEV